MKNEVYIRVDGSAQIGLGHIVRCIALAQMLKGSFNINFACKEIPDDISNYIIKNGFNLLLISNEERFVNNLNNGTIIVIDHYYLDSNYQKSIKDKGVKLVCIDDLCDKEFFADVIINISANVQNHNYKAQDYTIFALGLKYALLRPEFLKGFKVRKLIPDKKNVFICLGGSDVNNKTLQILKKIQNQRHKIINIVVGISYPFIDDLIKYINDYKLSSKVKVHCNIGEKQMSKLMRSCGIAICSASSVSIEYLSISSGVILLICTAKNQINWYNYVLSQKLGYKFSKKNSTAAEKLVINYDLKKQLFDGGQKKRYLKLFNSL